jgi:acetylornithine deacetylase
VPIRDTSEGSDARRIAAALVAIPSANPRLEPGGAGEAEIAGWCGDWLSRRGFAVRLVDAEPGRTSVLARLRRGAGRRLILNGHLDTVGVAGMTVPPLGEAMAGRLYGRGAADMKGGVAALLAAAGRLAGSRDWTGELVVALTADEEHASAGVQALLAAGLEGDAAIVCEPTGLAVMPAHKGFVWIEVVVTGRAAHGSRPERGVDAIRNAGRLLVRLDRLDAELRGSAPHLLLGHGSIHAGTITGGTAPSIYPDRCELVLERRTLPGEDAASALAEIETLLRSLHEERPAFHASARVLLARNGTEVPGSHPLVASLLAVLPAAGRQHPRLHGMSAWVDAAFLNEAGIPAVCFGPGSIEQAHAADEWVDLDDIDAAAAVLEACARNFLAG